MAQVKQPRLQTNSSDYGIKLTKVQPDVTKSIFFGLHQTRSWLFSKLKRGIFKAIKLCCSSTVQHPEGISHAAGVEGSAALQVLPQTAPGNQAVMHIWIVLHTNGITFRDEELARKRQ